MKTWIWILSLCLWLPQAWAQKVQIFDAPGSAPGYEPAKTPAPVNIPPQPTEVTQESAATPDASVGLDGRPVAQKPPEPTQQEKDLETIMEAVRKGTTIVQLIRDPILRPKLVSAYQKNPLTDLPEPLVRASVIGQFSKNEVGAWLIQNVPPLQNFLVEFVRDPVALGTMLRILNKTDDLMFYANVSIVLFFVMYFVRRQVLFTMESRFKRIVVRLSFTFIFWFGTYWAYSAKFGEYLTPTWEIFSKHFF
jgi:hypothetical protein